LKRAPVGCFTGAVDFLNNGGGVNRVSEFLKPHRRVTRRCAALVDNAPEHVDQEGVLANISAPLLDLCGIFRDPGLPSQKVGHKPGEAEVKRFRTRE